MHKFTLKLFLDPASSVDAEAVVPVFHAWIQTHALADHLPVDVTDYAHVQDGPGIVLITHEANLSLDRLGGRPGLTYQRKQPFPGADTPEQRLAALFKYTLHAARLLETAPALAGRARFRTDEFSLKVADRLHAPNTPETFAAVRPVLESVLKSITGAPASALNHTPAPNELFEVKITIPPGQTLGDLLSRAG